MAGKVLARVGLGSKMDEKMLTEAGYQMVQVPISNEEDLLQYAADADAVMAGANDPYTKKVIQTMGKCKIISRLGIGFNNIDVEEATRQGIAVAAVSDASVHEVSDHAMAFLLAFSRKIFPLTQAVRKGAWKTGTSEIVKVRGKMFRLNQQTLGLVGVGRFGIGSRVAQKARAFGMRVLGCDPYLTAPELQHMDVEKVDFDQLLKESDFISIHAPLTPETRGMFGLKEFRKMKPSAVVINTARGAIIDEQALYQALKEGSIAGAGLDVSNPEPPGPDNPLFQLEQVLVTAHSAFYSETSTVELHLKATEAIIQALRGDWPPGLVNLQVKEQTNRRIVQVEK